jgi:hypothetical protein
VSRDEANHKEWALLRIYRIFGGVASAGRGPFEEVDAPQWEALPLKCKGPMDSPGDQHRKDLVGGLE